MEQQPQQTQQVPQQPTIQPQQTPQAPVSIYAGFWMRCAAYTIDHIVVGIAQSIIFVIIAIVLGFSFFAGSGLEEFFTKFENAEEPDMGIIFFILGAYAGMIAIYLAVLYTYRIVLTHKYQATLGKMALGIKVVSADGNKLTLGMVILRETLGKFISRLIICIGYAIAGLMPQKEALHDMIATSRVVHNDPANKHTVVAIIINSIIGLLIVAYFGMIIFVMTLGFMEEARNDDFENYETIISDREVENTYPLVELAADDPKVLAAQKQAQSKLDYFIDELQNSTPQESRLFSINADFVEGQNHEHMWVDVTSYANGVFSGTLGNDPEILKDITYGSTVDIERDAVEDWVIHDSINNKTEGSFLFPTSSFSREVGPAMR